MAAPRQLHVSTVQQALMPARYIYQEADLLSRASLPLGFKLTCYLKVSQRQIHSPARACLWASCWTSCLKVSDGAVSLFWV